MRRRKYLGTLTGSTALIAGCLELQFGPDVRLEYELTVDKDPQQLPEDLRSRQHDDNPEGRRSEGHQWVVVQFEVIEGELNAGDMFTNSRVETESDYYYHLSYTTEFAKGIKPRSILPEGADAIALYQIPEDEESVDWDLSQMDQDIEIQEV